MRAICSYKLPETIAEAIKKLENKKTDTHRQQKNVKEIKAVIDTKPLEPTLY
jgi:hypothetical protein